MTNLLLARAHTGRAMLMTLDDFLERIGSSPRGMTAALGALRYDKPVVFAMPEIDEVFVVQRDDPQWYNRSFDELVQHAIPFHLFRMNESGQIVISGEPDPEPDDEPDDTATEVYRFEAKMMVHLNGGIYVAARSEDEARNIIEAEIERCKALNPEQLGDDPFWRLLSRILIEDASDYLYEVVSEVPWSSVELLPGPPRTVTDKPDLHWCGDPDD